jgi:hypothetical protein
VPQAGGGNRTVTAATLLARTALYKVGHRSHNATLREKGLELMTSPDLVAMIPTDEAWAFGAGKEWLMPYPQLWARLKERTRGRVLRADTGVPAASAVETSARKEFQARVRATELYVECDIPFQP